MAIPNPAGTDKPAMAPAGEGASAARTAGGQDNGEKFVLDFVDKNAAEKGFRELQAMNTRISQENAQFRKDSETAKALKAIADNQAALAQRFARDEITAEEYEAQIEQKAESMECSPKLLHYMGTVLSNARKESDAQREQSMTALMERLESLDAGVKEQALLSSDIYRQHGEEIDAVVEKTSMSREQVIAVLAAMPATATAEGASAAPGTMGGAGAVAAAQGKKEGLSDEENAKYRALMGGRVSQAQLDAKNEEELAAAIQQERIA